MFPCPHCGETIDVGPPAKVSWYKYDPGGPTMPLGCGTLILIAIIVVIFSGGNDTDAIHQLQKEVQTLEQKIDDLAARPGAEPKE